MTHARKSIIDELILAALAIPIFGGRVFEGGAFPSGDDQLPACRVDISEESVETFLPDQRQFRAAIIECVVRALQSDAVPVSQVLDDADEQLSVAFFASTGLMALSQQLEWESMAKEYETTGEKIRGEITIRFRYLYSVDGANPTTVLP